MLRDDAPDDGQAQAAAAALGRVVRHEQFFAVRGGNPGPLSDTTNRTTAFAASCCVSIARGGMPSAAAGCSAHRFDGVVHEVDDDAADLLDVEPHRRQAGGNCRSIRIWLNRPL